MSSVPPDRPPPTEPTRPTGAPVDPTRVTPPGPAREVVVEPRVVEEVVPAAVLLEDLRSLRRWLTIVGLVALTALGVAGYSLFRSADKDETERQSRVNRERAEALDRRLDQAETRLRRAGEESDVSSLQRRLADQEADTARLERALAKARSDASEATAGAADQEDAIRELDDRTQELADSITDLRREARSGGSGSP